MKLMSIDHQLHNFNKETTLRSNLQETDVKTM